MSAVMPNDGNSINTNQSMMSNKLRVNLAIRKEKRLARKLHMEACINLLAQEVMSLKEQNTTLIQKNAFLQAHNDFLRSVDIKMPRK